MSEGAPSYSQCRKGDSRISVVIGIFALAIVTLLAAPSRTLAQVTELEGLSVLDAITVLEAEGLQLIYSSDLVHPWMSVRESRESPWSLRRSSA